MRRVFPIPTLGYSGRVPADDDQRSGPAPRELGADRERHAQRQRDRRARGAAASELVWPATAVPCRGTWSDEHERLRSRKPLASLSLDADNQWSYMKIHGDDGWELVPVLPRRPRAAGARRARIATASASRSSSSARTPRSPRTTTRSARWPRAGHEIGNHSFRHEPWLHRYSEAELDEELAAGRGRDRGRDRACARRVPGSRATASRRPTLRVLLRRGYVYDASTLPTYIGPLARAYYFRHRAAHRRAAGRARAALRHVGGRPPAGAAVPLGGRRPHAPRAAGHDAARAQGADPRQLPARCSARYSPAAARAVLRRARCRRLSRRRRRAVDPAAPARPHLRRRRARSSRFFPGMQIPTGREARPGRLVPRPASGATSRWCRWGSTPGRSRRATCRCARRSSRPRRDRERGVRPCRTLPTRPVADGGRAAAVPGAVREPRPFVSVIVPAYNEAAIVVDTLTAALRLPDLARGPRTGGRSSSSTTAAPTTPASSPTSSRRTHRERAHPPPPRELPARPGAALRVQLTHGRLHRGHGLRPQLRRRSPRPHALHDPGLEGADRHRVARTPRAATTTNIPFGRRVLSRGANWLLSRAAGGELTTVTGMVRVYDGPLPAQPRPAGDGHRDQHRDHLQGADPARPDHRDPGPPRLVVPRDRGRPPAATKFRSRADTISSLFSSFLFRPFLFFMLPGLILLASRGVLVRLVHLARLPGVGPAVVVRELRPHRRDPERVRARAARLPLHRGHAGPRDPADQPRRHRGPGEAVLRGAVPPRDLDLPPGPARRARRRRPGRRPRGRGALPG